MQNRNRALQSHQAGRELIISNPVYKQWVFRYTFLELEKDLSPNGDITTELIKNNQEIAVARFIAKEDGILCGIDELKYFLTGSDRTFKPSLIGEFTLKTNFQDGDKIIKNDVVLEIKGFFSDLMKIERVALNLIMRMSGISTLTRNCIDLIGDSVLLAPTRKTLWGLLDKKACFIGGGCTHRLNLSDAILIKDTHLDFIKNNLFNLDLDKVYKKIRFFEIEVADTAAAMATADFFVKSKLVDDFLCVILFDNMNPNEIKNSIIKITTAYGNNFIFEASGGINITNLNDYANTQVDVISMGSLTHSSKALDFSCKIEKI